MQTSRVSTPTVFLVTDDGSYGCFGTAFVIHRDDTGAYLLTCAHVIEDIGVENVRVAGYKPAVVAIGKEGESPDLAVLRVEGLDDQPCWSLRSGGREGKFFNTEGFCKDGNQYLQRKLQGKLGDRVPIILPNRSKPFQSWDLKIEKGRLQPGNSGSPVWNPENQGVIGIVSRRQVEGHDGLAIAIDALDEIWEDMPPNLIHTSQRKQAVLVGAIAAIAVVSVVAVAVAATTFLTPQPSVCPPVSLTPSEEFQVPDPSVTANIVVSGSTSMADLNQNLADAFRQRFPGVRVTFTASGSEVGLDDLSFNTAHIAAVSTLIGDDIMRQNSWRAFTIAPAPIAVVVGRSNDYLDSHNGLSSEQVKGIYTGKISDWSKLDPNLSDPIRVINRHSTSGTFQEFQSLALNNEDFGSNVQEWPQDETTPVLSQLEKDGIYYATCHQVANQSSVQILNIDGHSPASNQYPYQRPLLYVYAMEQNGQPSREVAAFLGFVNSEEGRKIIDSTLSKQN